jgi:methyltransferase (TIGR00027 family)
MKDKSYLALSNAALRAMESYYPKDERLFYDRVSYYLLPPLWKLFLKFMKFSFLRRLLNSMREKQMPGVIGNLLYRTKFIDEILKENINENIEQVLILGAGFDTRAYRIEGIQDIIFYEVDCPETSFKKKERLKKLYKDIPQNVNLLSIDFEENKLEEKIKKSNFNKNKKTLVIWEGVTQYIDKEALNNVLDYLSSIKSESKLLFTYIKKEIIDGSNRSEIDQNIISFAEKMGSPWKTGINRAEIEELLENKGLILLKDVGAKDYKKLYSHLTKREINVYNGERLAYVEVK